ncbi:LacI family DNA-binding transcriptional regulator [Mesotoga sp. H07.pep.5.3]|jgi:LacI family transcriptional regulator|uniref:LacI family DNA-binding transcriptional regulator n=1 Tax=Mesotoga sp. H07.pep.5.3 TaxID=1421003 RepID=UPI000C196355|nr:LacI family DNA-binding transcriptional regulator [Mesotoga sp. H07.pep.5.3]PIJ62946.1 hypothetical protein V513_03175 [Mesotoga sp. H07.pep.5.3]
MGIKEVAKRAGVSISTVSRVINKSAKVSEIKRKKVLEAVKILGYKPNDLARGLRNMTTSTVGVIIPDITNPFFPSVIRGAGDILHKAGITPMIYNSDGNISLEIEEVNNLLSKRVDGLLFMHAGESQKVIKIIESTNIPVVFLDRTEDGRFSSVISDNITGMKSIAELAYSLGHRDYWYIGGESGISSARERLEAIKEFEETHPDISVVYESSTFSYEGGVSSFESLSEKFPLPSIIICGNDLLAFGVIDSCIKKGLKVPQDISVTGFDDNFLAAHYDPPLTTVQQSSYELGATGAKLLLEFIFGKRKRPVTKVLPVSLIVRKSTNAPNKKLKA